MLKSRSLAVALAGLLAQGACGLYADEAGKLDWHRQNLGRFVSASFDGRGGLTVVGEVRGKYARAELVGWVIGRLVIGFAICPHPVGSLAGWGVAESGRCCCVVQ